MIKYNMDTILTSIATNKMFIGCAMLIMNIGTKHIVADITPALEEVIKSPIFKKIIVFCMFFIGTRDIMTSIILTFAFTVIINGLLNEKSKYSLLWK